MFEVGFNPIYPAEHRIEYCSSVRTASPDKPVSAPMEPHTLLSPLRLYIWMEILTLCISALDSLLQIELLRATTSVRDGPGYIILQISWESIINQNIKTRKQQNQNLQLVPCKTFEKYY